MHSFVVIFSAFVAIANAKPQIDPRIVGGFVAQEKQFPYTAALFINPGTDEENFCGGSLISPNYVLTAAHCAVISKEITVVLGSVETDVEVEGQLTIDSSEVIIPENYNKYFYDWDLALVKLPEPVELNDYIQTIPLAEGNDTYAGELALVTGWGIQWGVRTTVGPNLRYVENVILSNHQCIKRNPTYEAIVLDSHICQSTLAYRGACGGDSGGPLVVDGVQVGIVSLGLASCFNEEPVIFTRITSFRDWIKENAGV